MARDALWLGSGIYKMEAPRLILEKPRSGLSLEFKRGFLSVQVEIG